MTPEIIDPRTEEIVKILPFLNSVSLGENYNEAANRIQTHIELPGVKFCAATPDYVLSIFGVYRIRKGVGMAWYFNSSFVDKHKIWFHRTMKSYMEQTIATLDLHRLEGHVKIDYKTGVNWALRMGFKMEGVMKRYTKTSDYFMMAWTKDK